MRRAAASQRRVRAAWSNGPLGGCNRYKTTQGRGVETGETNPGSESECPQGSRVGNPASPTHSETTGRTDRLREHDPNPGSGWGYNPVRSTPVRVHRRRGLPLGRRWGAVGTIEDLTE